MDFKISEETKTALMLSGVFGKDRSVAPLNITEYNKLVRWLVGNNKSIVDLVEHGMDSSIVETGIDPERLSRLLDRGVSLGFALEEWQRNGVWVISRADKQYYPQRLKQHLKDKAPPVLFGIGDLSLLEGGGVGIVGSRNVDSEAEAFTREAAALCAREGLPVNSGGAKGVDRFAMASALEAGGVVVGVLADSLLKKSREQEARRGIAEGRALLVSPYNPKAGFNVGNAMGRNKLIYAFSDYALVVNSDYNKGGTWAGATEELKNENRIPVFVRTEGNIAKGNKELLQLGARPWPAVKDVESLADALKGHTEETASEGQTEYTLFPSDDMVREPEAIEKPEVIEEPKETTAPAETTANKVQPKDALYLAVLPVLAEYLTEPAGGKDLASTLDVSTTQLNAWLKRAVKEKKVKKLAKPVRYQWVAD